VPDNAAFIDQIIEHWFTDKQRILDHLADDCVYVVGTGETSRVPFYGTFRGRARVAEFFRLHDDSQNTIKCFKPPRSHYAVANDKVVVSGNSTYRIVPSGATYDSYWVLVWQVRDGRIAGLHFMFDDEILKAQFTK
jgi:ketosteroid isomerase-like protein